MGTWKCIAALIRDYQRIIISYNMSCKSLYLCGYATINYLSITHCKKMSDLTVDVVSVLVNTTISLHYSYSLLYMIMSQHEDNVLPNASYPSFLGINLNDLT